MNEIQEPEGIFQDAFFSLKDWEAGFEVPSTIEDPIAEQDAAAQWLEQARQEQIIDPLRAEVERIYGNSFAFLTAEAWQEHQRVLLENPDDPDAVFKLAKKLADADSAEALEAAKHLVFLPGKNGKNTDASPKLRWPDHEDHATLAAWIFRRENNFNAIIRILTNADRQPRFPKNPTAKRLLARAFNELHYYETAADMIGRSNEGELYRDPLLMLNFVRALLELGQDMEILLLFSGANPDFRERAQTPSFVRPTLDFLHRRRRHDLMLHIVEQVLLANPNASTAEHFVDFASRALNEARQFKKSVRLLVSAEDPRRARFPKNIRCVKGLAYALIGLRRRHDAEIIIDAAIANGLPRNEFLHLDRRLQGGARPPRPHRRDPRLGEPLKNIF
jgi:hypothetical protein